MVNQKEGSFNGFSAQTLDFLKNLGENNSRDWFEAHKDQYRKYLLEPLRNLASDLGPFMLSIDPYLEVSPGRAVSRIYRDTRFSRDKSPYKTNMWAAFKRPSRDWKADPVFFFEIFQDWYRYGMGFYSAERQTMDRLREVIDRRPEEFLQAVSAFSGTNTFVLEGDKYKKTLKKDLPEEIQDWYQRKSLCLICNKKAGRNLFSSTLIGDLTAGFRLATPFYHFLWKLKQEENKKAISF